MRSGGIWATAKLLDELAHSTAKADADAAAAVFAAAAALQTKAKTVNSVLV